MKRLLIISPYFPPVNAADMQRVRMSLPYFLELGWEAEVVTVDERYTDLPQDELLLQSLPAGIKIHRVKALDKRWTSKLGLGSLALRSLWFYRQKGNQLLKHGRFDLVFFSTTQFPVCVLGAYWKKRFGIPYIIDLQDPWRPDYYLDKPKEQRPPKFWFAYRLDSWLEPMAIKQAGGLMSVSASYIDTLKKRYAEIKGIPASVITFGHFEPDMAIAKANDHRFPKLLDPHFKNMVYIGRGGVDMQRAIEPLFAFLKREAVRFKGLRLYFIGTSYAPAGEGKPSIRPLAEAYGIGDQVVEITDRISYYHALATLQQADALFIPGSDDPAYTASKIYPYLMTRRPLLTVFNPASSVIKIMRAFGAAHVYDYNTVTNADIGRFLNGVIGNSIMADTCDREAIAQYSAGSLTAEQVELFNRVLSFDR
jgi:hypothetical protein